ncbi:MAG: hypothetical protein JHC31_13305 [Sulfurihydrogenibium sp.]|jgi:hypothetical protein|nr:hypothetical protein [Sulfurihydrogenibium sp.]
MIKDLFKTKSKPIRAIVDNKYKVINDLRELCNILQRSDYVKVFVHNLTIDYRNYTGLLIQTDNKVAYLILELIDDAIEKNTEFHIQAQDLLSLYEYMLQTPTDAILLELDFNKNKIVIDKKLKIRIFK